MSHCPKEYSTEGDKPVAEDSLGDRYWREVYGQCVCPQQDTPGNLLLTHLPRLPHTLRLLLPSQELTLRRGQAGVWGDSRGTDIGVWCMDSVSSDIQTHLGTTSSHIPRGKLFSMKKSRIQCENLDFLLNTSFASSLYH